MLLAAVVESPVEALRAPANAGDRGALSQVLGGLYKEGFSKFPRSVWSYYGQSWTF